MLQPPNKIPPTSLKPNCAPRLGYSGNKKVWITQLFLLAFKATAPFPTQLRSLAGRDPPASTTSRAVGQAEQLHTLPPCPVYIFYVCAGKDKSLRWGDNILPSQYSPSLLAYPRCHTECPSCQPLCGGAESPCIAVSPGVLPQGIHHHPRTLL